MLKRIKFATVPVRDQDKALAFWTKVMGCTIATDQPMGPGQRWIELKLPGAQTGLVLHTAPGMESHIGTFQGLSFTVDDVDRFYREATAKGVEFETPPTKADWGTHAVFKDPDGNSFVIGE